MDISIKICFSVKANPWIIDYIQSQVDYFEVCSIGELEWCLMKGIPAEKITAGGVCKSNEDLEKMLVSGLDALSIESMTQWDYVTQSCIASTERTFLLRLSSGNQFGLDWKQIKTICQNPADHEFPHARGLHFYSGTQKRTASVILAELEMLDKQMRELCGCRNNINILQYGPGIGVPYFTGDEADCDKKIFLDIASKLNELAKRYTIRLEAGRMLCAPAGQYVSKIMDKKQIYDKIFYILDGGRHHLIYYGQGIGAKNPRFSILHQQEKDRNLERAIVCGCLCTAHDILLKNVEIEECDLGDCLIFHNTGAYSTTEPGVLFLRHKYPDIFILEESGQLHQVFHTQYLI